MPDHISVRGIFPAAGVFDRVVVMPHTLAGAVVSWWLDSRRFTDEGPYVFSLQWSEAGAEDDFITIAGPTTGNTLVDTDVRRHSKLPLSYYRIKLETPYQTLYSAVQPVTGAWNRHDYLLAREIIRRHLLVQRKFIGFDGLYLSRKQWGELCPLCLDQLTREVTNAHCAACYGTGFVGGYHEPFHLLVTELDRGPNRVTREDNIGVTCNQTFTGKTVAYPFLVSKDILVDTGTDERYSVETVKEASLLRGTPLLYRVEFRLLEPDNVAYTIPLGGSSSSSSSSSSSAIAWPSAPGWNGVW